MLELIDVSSNTDGALPNLTNVSGVISRGTYGTIPDKRYTEFENTVFPFRDVVRGAYVFLRPQFNQQGHQIDQTPEKQVQAMLAIAKRAEIFFVDWEEDKFTGGTNGWATRSEYDRAIAELAKTHTPGGYTSLSTFPWDGQQKINWVAAYDGITIPASRINLSNTIHQFSGGNIDWNHFFGSVEQLYNLAGRSTTVPVNSPPLSNLTQHQIHVLHVEHVRAENFTKWSVKPQASTAWAQVTANQRSAPQLGNNVLDVVSKGTAFHVDGVTDKGQVVGGSGRWFCNYTGTIWMHSSVLGGRI